MEIILSIDIGYVTPIFIVSYYNNNSFEKILIFNNIKFKHYIDSFKYLKYFFSLNLTKVLIEKQYIYSRNIALMTFIHGFFIGRNVSVEIVNPIARLRTAGKATRAIKKKFSVNIINDILKKQNYNYAFQLKDNDICDALNLALYHKHNNHDYIEAYNIPIKNICFMYLTLK